MAETPPEIPVPLPGHGDEPPGGFFALAVVILWAVIGIAFGREAVVNFNDWLKPTGTSQDGIIALVDLVLCAASGVLAVILWRARRWLPRCIADTAVSVATNPAMWVAVALVILIVSALNHFTFPTQSTFPSANEIAQAVVKALPTTSAPINTAGEPPKDTAPKYADVRLYREGDAIVLYVIPTISDHIAILLQYSCVFPSFTCGKAIGIQQASSVLRDVRLRFVLGGQNPPGSKHWQWYDSSPNSVPAEITQPEAASIIIEGPDKGRQYVDFMMLMVNGEMALVDQNVTDILKLWFAEHQL